MNVVEIWYHSVDTGLMILADDGVWYWAVPDWPHRAKTRFADVKRRDKTDILDGSLEIFGPFNSARDAWNDRKYTSMETVPFKLTKDLVAECRITEVLCKSLGRRVAMEIYLPAVIDRKGVRLDPRLVFHEKFVMGDELTDQWGDSYIIFETNHGPDPEIAFRKIGNCYSADTYAEARKIAKERATDEIETLIRALNGSDALLA